MLFTALHPLLPNPLYDSIEVLKKGGRAKKKRTKRGKKAGDMVVLQKGMPPMASGAMGALRLQSPGMVFGGGLPATLQSTTYASAPQVAKPLSRVEFVGSSDAFYNRNRNKSDDIVLQVNPSDIAPDVTPSRRLVKSENPNAPPLITYNIISSLPFQGEQPRLNDSFRQSVRAMASQPTTGYMNTKLPIMMDAHGVGHLPDEGVHYAVPSGVELEEQAPKKSVKEVTEKMRKALEPEPVVASAPAYVEPLITDIVYPKKGSLLYKSIVNFAKPNTAKKLGFPSWDAYVHDFVDKNEIYTQEAFDAFYDEQIAHYESQLKRGGRVRHSAF